VPNAIRRCAVYTRKSSEEGLDQDFNSLHAQREACEAYIKSQVGEGWKLVSTPYDDGGISGGTMERPALQRLLGDIQEGKVDVIVVYKVDRLTRSLADFAKMVEIFDARGASFVAVTQQFNTTTSMGRLTLNVLLSFAQFEREVTGERIRDKIAASKAKGIWMGGTIPLGYDAVDRKLIVNTDDAKMVQDLFHRYIRLRNVRLLQLELEREGLQTKRRISRKGNAKGGGSYWKGPLYRILTNPVYIGEISHKGKRYPGQHEPIIDREVWERVQQMLQNTGNRLRGQSRVTDASPLVGKLFDEAGQSLTPTHTKKGTSRYRYYISRALASGGPSAQNGWRLPAQQIEAVVAASVRDLLSDRASIASAAEEADLGDQCARLFEIARQARDSDESSIFAMVERAALTSASLALTVVLHISGKTISIERNLPIAIKRRGVEMRMVIEGRDVQMKADPVLVKALARAHGWFEQLCSGRAESMQDIARKEGVMQSYVSRHIKLVFLAPTVTAAILTGAQPVSLTADQIANRCTIDPDWRRQSKALGFL
jgi:DNA invertase Pin-like site-specific DNA recombinase